MSEFTSTPAEGEAPDTEDAEGHVKATKYGLPTDAADAQQDEADVEGHVKATKYGLPTDAADAQQDEADVEGHRHVANLPDDGPLGAKSF